MDTNFKAEYDARGAWGMVASIDVHGADLALMTDASALQTLIDGLVTAADMKKHGPAHIERFGDETKHPGPGYSAMQFIETSSLTIHCDEPERRVFIDLFSCKFFEPAMVADFAKTFLKASEASYTTVVRA